MYQMQWKVYSKAAYNGGGCDGSKGVPKNSGLFVRQEFRVLAVHGLSPTILGGNILLCLRSAMRKTFE